MDVLHILLAVFLTISILLNVFLFWRLKQPNLQHVRLEEQLKQKELSLNESKENLLNTFKALSAETLKANNTSFLELAKESLSKHQQEAKGDLESRQKAIDALVKPLVESLEKVDHKIQDIEKQRVGAYSSLLQQLDFMNKSQEKLQNETGNLVNALKTPQVRGRWGEMTLKRVAELAGMIEHCDFFEQESKNSETGRLRPDMIVRLAGGKQIVIDAKVPLAAYLQSLEARNETDRETFLEDHARQLQTHMRQLGQKNYWDQFNPTPDFVVMFVPGESFYNAALNKNHNLIEEGMQMKVMLASPTNLVSLLKTISYGWRQEQLAQNAAEISQAGKVLYERLVNLSSHFADLGQALKRSNEAYNNAIGTLESRVLPQARKFETLGIKGKTELAELIQIDTPLRQVQSPELILAATSPSHDKASAE